MSRWFIMLACSLALAVSASAQDDLDALLAGLGDDPAAAEAAAPAEAPAAVEAAAAEPAPVAEAPAETPIEGAVEAPVEAPATNTSQLESLVKKYMPDADMTDLDILTLPFQAVHNAVKGTFCSINRLSAHQSGAGSASQRRGI